MKKLLFALICFMLAGCSSSGLLNTDGKATLKVLYVGGAAEFETFGSHRSKEGMEASALERTAAWEAMLKERFDSVATVQGKNYKPEMSKGYDVTIFDGTIPAIRPRVGEIKEIMNSCGAQCAMMSGSGPSVFGIFPDAESATNAVSKLCSIGAAAFVCHPTKA